MMMSPRLRSHENAVKVKASLFSALEDDSFVPTPKNKQKKAVVVVVSVDKTPPPPTEEVKKEETKQEEETQKKHKKKKKKEETAPPPTTEEVKQVKTEETKQEEETKKKHKKKTKKEETEKKEEDTKQTHKKKTKKKKKEDKKQKRSSEKTVTKIKHKKRTWKAITKVNPKNMATKNNGFCQNVRAVPLKIDLETFSPPIYEKDDYQVECIEKITNENFVLQDLATKGSTEDINTFIQALEPIQAECGDIIVEQGSNSECPHFYMIEYGMVEFHRDGILVGSAQAGETFGEINLLLTTPEKASIVASSENHEPTKLLRIDQETFRGIMQTSESVTTADTKAILPSLPTSVHDDEDEDDNNNEEKTFDDWLSNSKLMQEREMIRNSLHKHVDVDHLERISILGEGQFGEVWLVATELPGTGIIEKQTFALKVQYKEDEVRGDGDDAIEAIRNEIRIMEELHHPFIANLLHTYESDTAIDMLMGLVTGGELWDLIHRCDSTTEEWTSTGIPESHAQFYAMILTDTLAYMHGRNYIFRDLKPENIMIDKDGYPIIVDFGFAKYCPDQTYTFCGTPNYVAPEIIKNSGHNAGADYWALGVVIYEMITGENPFYFEGMEQVALYQAIVDEPYEPLKKEDNHSASVCDLISNLLEKDPSCRLGMRPERATGILEHDWFHGLSLDLLRNKQVKAPWIPSISGDTKKDDSIEDDNKAQAMEAGDGVSSRSMKAEEEARCRAEEEARLRAETEAQRLAKEEEEAARTRAEEEARQLAAVVAEEARLRAVEEARMKAEEEARLRAEVLARRLAAEEARTKAEEEARLRAEEEARMKAEEEARLRAEVEARRLAVEEARTKAEEEACLRAEEEARRLAAEEARTKAEEEARRLAAEEEARLRTEEEARIRAEDEARRLAAEEEARLREAEEARRLAAEEARIRVEEEARRLATEEAARLRAEEQTRMREEAVARIRAEEEAREAARIKAEEEDASRRAEEEARLVVEQEGSKKEGPRGTVEDDDETASSGGETYDTLLVSDPEGLEESSPMISHISDENKSSRPAWSETSEESLGQSCTAKPPADQQSGGTIELLSNKVMEAAVEDEDDMASSGGETYDTLLGSDPEVEEESSRMISHISDQNNFSDPGWSETSEASLGRGSITKESSEDQQSGDGIELPLNKVMEAFPATSPSIVAKPQIKKKPKSPPKTTTSIHVPKSQQMVPVTPAAPDVVEPETICVRSSDVYVALTVMDCDVSPTQQDYIALLDATKKFYSAYLQKTFGDNFQHLDLSVQEALFNSARPNDLYNVYVAWDIEAIFTNTETAAPPAPDRHRLSQLLVRLDIMEYLKDYVRTLSTETPFCNAIGIYTQQQM